MDIKPWIGCRGGREGQAHDCDAGQGRVGLLTEYLVVALPDRGEQNFGASTCRVKESASARLGQVQHEFGEFGWRRREPVECSSFEEALAKMIECGRGRFGDRALGRQAKYG